MSRNTPKQLKLENSKIVEIGNWLSLKIIFDFPVSRLGPKMGRFSILEAAKQKI